MLKLRDYFSGHDSVERMSRPSDASSYLIGPFRLDVRTRSLARGGSIVPLGPKVIDTLIVLVRRHGELVTKAELMEAVWPDDFVEEANLTQNVYRLRRTLGAGGVRNAITTMPARGYCFTAEVRAGRSPRPAPPEAPVVLAGMLATATVALLLSLWPAGRQIDRLGTESRQAYRLGLYHFNMRRDAAHAWQALHYFKVVALHDARNPLGYAGVAYAYLSIFDAQCGASVARCRDIQRQALENAQRAVDLDPRSAEAHTALAMALNELYSADVAAEREFRTAIALDPTYALAHHWYGNFLTVQGRYGDATREHRTALLLEPTSPATYAWLAEDAFLSRHYYDAIAYARQGESLSPLGHPTLVLLGLAYERTGRLREAGRCFRRLSPVEARALMAALWARHGARDRAVAMMRAIEPAEVAATGASEATAFAWMAIGDDARARAYILRTPLPNRIERNFLARDPRWSWGGAAARDARWITAV